MVPQRVAGGGVQIFFFNQKCFWVAFPWGLSPFYWFRATGGWDTFTGGVTNQSSYIISTASHLHPIPMDQITIPWASDRLTVITNHAPVAKTRSVRTFHHNCSILPSSSPTWPWHFMHLDECLNDQLVVLEDSPSHAKGCMM